MNLLVVSQYFWPENFRINDLVSELVKRGHTVTVLTGKPNYPDGDFFPDFLESPEKFTTYQGARILRVPILSRKKGKLRLFLNYISYALSATLFGIFHLWKEKFDAIFVFEPSPVTVGLPAIALRSLKQCPLAFWVLDQWPESLAAVGAVKSKMILQLVGRLVAFIYDHCDLILAPSKNLVTQIRQYCRDSKQIIYFPNWIEPIYSQNNSAMAPEVSVLKGSFNVMFAGNIGEAQDFPTILDAAEQLSMHNNIRWLIVGHGRMFDWVQKEVNRRQLKNFFLLGHYASNRMPSFYKHASALLVSLKPDPIFSMTIPGKIQSYLASGLPILGMLDGEGVRVIEEAHAGLTSPAGNSKKLAEIVLKMAMMSESERSKMGFNGRAYSEREFDRNLLVKKLEGLLTTLCSTS